MSDRELPKSPSASAITEAEAVRAAARRLTSSRLPTEEGEFELHLYRQPGDDKDHLALVMGDIAGQDVLVRIHSECFTGDVLGSLRCDCGKQLEQAMKRVAEAGRGAILYLRQEGRGIGLLEKLRAYNLQDAGYDTVEANLELGHRADERHYGVAADMLFDLGVGSVRLMTNNPTKVEGLIAEGFEQVERVALEVPATPENAGYLETKVKRMRHLLELDALVPNAARVASTPGAAPDASAAESTGPSSTLVGIDGAAVGRPTVTLTYAQSLDGSITNRRGSAMTLSSSQALELTHSMRARHDAILVGVETVIADDPRLTVRLVRGDDPQPVVLDSQLRLPLESQLLEGAVAPLIATTLGAPRDRQLALEARGAVVERFPADAETGWVDLPSLFVCLGDRGLRSLMVEGGRRVITSFLRADAVDRLVVTVAPVLVGGLSAIGDLGISQRAALPRLVRTRYRWVGESLVLIGEIAREGDDQQPADDWAGGAL